MKCTMLDDVGYMADAGDGVWGKLRMLVMLFLRVKCHADIDVALTAA